MRCSVVLMASPPVWLLLAMGIQEYLKLSDVHKLYGSPEGSTPPRSLAVGAELAGPGEVPSLPVCPFPDSSCLSLSILPFPCHVAPSAGLLLFSCWLCSLLRVGASWPHSAVSTLTRTKLLFCITNCNFKTLFVFHFAYISYSNGQNNNSMNQ